MLNAIAAVEKKLKECPSCVADPKVRQQLLDYLAGGNKGSGVTFTYQNDRFKDGSCAKTGYFNNTTVANWHTSPGCTCLPGTIAHELVHNTWKNIFTWDNEKEPESVQQTCFPLSACKF
jgi:hypothetical protein